MNDADKAKFEKVQELRKTGMTCLEACNKVGWPNMSKYYEVRAKLGQAKPKPANVAKKRQPSVQTITVQPETKERVMCVIGSPSEIAEVLRGLK